MQLDFDTHAYSYISVMQEMDGSKEEVAPLIQQLLQDKAVLLQECFGIQVGAEGHLAALPQLIEGHCPDLDRLPHFVLQLARDVDWEDEKQCFKGLAQVKCLMRITPCMVLLVSKHTETKPCSQQLESVTATAWKTILVTAVQVQLPCKETLPGGVQQEHAHTLFKRAPWQSGDMS